MLDDDKEYIEGFKEISFWVLFGYVRNFFVKMLLFGSLSSFRLVWEVTKDLLFEDVFYNERKRRNYFGID